MVCKNCGSDLKPGIKYESGNGSMANPYVVRTSG